MEEDQHGRYYEMIIAIPTNEENVGLHTLKCYFGPCLASILRTIEEKHAMRFSRSHLHRSMARKCRTTGSKECVLIQKVAAANYASKTVLKEYVPR